ncbi:LysE/ArgO family amino acid transporter [Nocardiopsis sp. MG754419]|uniref:LysE/ArgO family amino acid transporter n=1 Tax=Nocardiopsis sp. MG754419 TaxID=2259865 RepID=UPI001BA6ECA5|nr:LysE/ArgO family amino acid transporter [Nocardiopsis sp. MG754419]MBR8740652.1 amino acid transporter [Nocardiopsis sp. MG754419]
MNATLLPALLGLGTGLALIIAIGAQNAYLLRLGIDGNPRTVLAVVLVCAFSDAALIAAGVVGIGGLVQAMPAALVLIRFLGAGFLLVYGLLAAYRALKPGRGEALVPAERELRRDPEREEHGPRGADATPTRRPTPPGTPTGPGGTTATRVPAATSGAGTRGRASLRAAILTALALTWLNPHVYLDTVLFLGSLANQQVGDARWWWSGGALTASFVWFFALGFGARLLRPLFARPGAWRVLDGIIAVVMLALGLRLALGG